MNVSTIIASLQRQYPGKTIIKNGEPHPTEIICEIEPTADHPAYDVAIAIIDQSLPHVHHRSEELYEVLSGTLTVTINGSDRILHKNDTIVIHPGEVHSAKGNATWIRATSRPGWTAEDHILIKD